MSEALQAAAARTPGRFISGWSDRATVSPELRRIWNSYCGFAAWQEHTPTAVIAWVSVHFHEEDDEGKRMLTDVFLELLWDRNKTINSGPAEPAAK